LWFVNLFNTFAATLWYDVERLLSGLWHAIFAAPLFLLDFEFLIIY